MFQPEPRNSKANLFSQVIIRIKHIHSNDFRLTTNASIVAQKVISNDGLCSALKNSDNVEIVKILSNETHLSLSEGTLIPGHNLRKTRKIMLKTEVIELSLRMTVEVEMDS